MALEALKKQLRLMLVGADFVMQSGRGKEEVTVDLWRRLKEGEW